MSDTTKPGLLSAAKIETIRRALRGHIGSLEKRRMIERLLAHLDALAAGEVPDGEALGRIAWDAADAPWLSLSIWGWHELPEEVRAYYVAVATALYTQGREAGRAEGAGSETTRHLIEARNTAQRTAEEAHAEIARLQAALDAERALNALFQLL